MLVNEHKCGLVRSIGELPERVLVGRIDEQAYEEHAEGKPRDGIRDHVQIKAEAQDLELITVGRLDTLAEKRSGSSSVTNESELRGQPYASLRSKRHPPSPRNCLCSDEKGEEVFGYRLAG